MEFCQSAEFSIGRLFLARLPWDIVGILEGCLQKKLFSRRVKFVAFLLNRAETYSDMIFEKCKNHIGLTRPACGGQA